MFRRIARHPERRSGILSCQSEMAQTVIAVFRAVCSDKNRGSTCLYTRFRSAIRYDKVIRREQRAASATAAGVGAAGVNHNVSLTRRSRRATRCFDARGTKLASERPNKPLIQISVRKLDFLLPGVARLPLAGGCLPWSSRSGGARMLTHRQRTRAHTYSARRTKRRFILNRIH